MAKAEIKPDPKASKDAGKPVPGYTKQQFLQSAKYADKKDVLSALLEEEKEYSSDEVDQLVNGFLEQEAK